MINEQWLFEEAILMHSIDLFDTFGYKMKLTHTHTRTTDVVFRKQKWSKDFIGLTTETQIKPKISSC